MKIEFQTNYTLSYAGLLILKYFISSLLSSLQCIYRLRSLSVDDAVELYLVGFVKQSLGNFADFILRDVDSC